MNKSCWGCKFLYSVGVGYSNYTWEDTEVKCSKDRNPNLPASKPYDWRPDLASDNWPKTSESRCELYAVGQFVELDVDGEVLPEDETNDPEAIAAIDAHCGRSFEYERERRAKRSAS